MNIIKRFSEKIKFNPETECWDWTAATYNDGYGIFRLSGAGGGVCRAHRFSWEAYNGKIPEGLCVLHKCDNRKCVNPKHLFLGTKKDNTHDMISKNRFSVMKFSVDQVIKMRNMYKSGEYTYRELGNIFCVHNSVANKIVRGKSYFLVSGG